MTPAPYSPTTLKRIREGATASALGWDEDRYRSVCRKHGIECGCALREIIPPLPAAEADKPRGRPKCPETIEVSPLRGKRDKGIQPRNAYITVAISKDTKRRINNRTSYLGTSVATYLGIAIERLCAADRLQEFAEGEQ